MSGSQTPTWIQQPTFGAADRISDSDSRLIAYAHDEDGDESTALTLTSGIADPHHESAAMRAVIDLCNARAQIVFAMRAAAKTLDSVAYVATEGDTERPLRLLRAAIAKATGAAA